MDRTRQHHGQEPLYTSASASPTGGGRAVTRRGVLWSATRLAGAGGVACGLAGCAGSAGSAQPGSPAGENLRGVTVEFWHTNVPTHPTEVAKLKVLEHFARENPYGISFTAVAGATGARDQAPRVIAAMAGGTPPNLVASWNYFTADFFRQGGLVEIDKELKGNPEWTKARPNAYPALLKGLSWKEKLYGIPSFNSYYSMYCSPTALRRAGLSSPPSKGWTRDQFMDHVRTASRPPDVTGYDCDWTYSRTGMMSLNNGGGFINPEGTKAALDGEAALDTVEWQLSLVKAGLMRGHDGSPAGGYKELLPEQKVVFQLAVQARVPEYRQKGSEFATCYYPVGPHNRGKVSYTQGQAFCYSIFKHSDARKVQAALLAGLWASRLDSGLTFAQVGGVVPAYRNIVEAAPFQAEFKKDAGHWPFFDLLPHFVPFPSTPAFDPVDTMVTAKLRDIWAGKSSARDGLREANRLTQLLLDAAQKGN